MSREVPKDQPLTDADREYLHSRGEHGMVEYLDQQFPPVVAETLAGEELPDAYEEWKVADLQEELENRNLPKGGNKQELIDRLVADDKAAEESAGQ